MLTANRIRDDWEFCCRGNFAWRSGKEDYGPNDSLFPMKADPVLLSTLMNLPEAERFEIAMAILDQCSPFAMTEDEIAREAGVRQDDLESGNVRDIGYEELIAGLSYCPSGLTK